MNRNIMRTKLLVTAVALGTCITCGVANAAVFHLCAGTTTKAMPDGAVVEMWGYALDDDANLTNGCGGPIQSPGPLLTVAHDDPDPNVTINLLNNLPVGTSLMVPGQSGAMAPVYTPADAQGRVRVTSLAAVAAPGAIQSYTWSNFKPGSYTYHSGTHMAVQVQMGLYGGMKKDAALNTAYTGVPYAQEAILFYSEIDPVLHAAVANGSYGTAPAPTSTLNYQPKYFLVNGSAAGDVSLTGAGAGQRTLLRIFNMGLRSVAPTVLGQHVKVVAEDGRPYPYAREQYSLLMAAGKTHDAILTPASDGSYPVYDRLLNLSSGAAAGGFYASLTVGAAAPGTPSAVADSYSTAEDTPLSIAAPGVLLNDTDPDGGTLTAQLASAAAHGTVVLNATGDFIYTPTANFSGTDSFSYTATDGVLSSAPTPVVITVTAVNDAPLAANDSYNGTADTPLVVAAPGVLGNDSDLDGDVLSAAVVTNPAKGTLVLNANGSFNYSPNAGTSGIDTFTYANSDGVASSNVATVTLNIAVPVNQPPVAADDAATMPMNTILRLDLLANDSDPDGTLDPASVVISGTLKKGNLLVNNNDGTVTYTPRFNFRGTDTFTYTVKDNQGATSNSATVRINVVR